MVCNRAGRKASRPLKSDYRYKLDFTFHIVLGNNGLVIGGADGSGVTIEPWTDDVKGEIQLVPVI